MDDQSVLNTYAGLMAAIKQRHQLLRLLLADHRGVALVDGRQGIPPWAVAEFAQFQIRMICETFAIACLLAHGDIEGTRSGKLATAYQADFIIKALERLHPHFYPRPVNQIIQDGKPIALADVKKGFLTKDELLKSYYHASTFLHVGDLRNILERKVKFFNFDSAATWATRLFALLNIHQIYLVDAPGEPPGPPGLDGVPVPKRQIGVVMHAQDGKPYASLLVRVVPE